MVVPTGRIFVRQITIGLFVFRNFLVNLAEHYAQHTTDGKEYKHFKWFEFSKEDCTQPTTNGKGGNKQKNSKQHFHITILLCQIQICCTGAEAPKAPSDEGAVSEAD